MQGAGKVLGSFQSALRQCLVDDHLGLPAQSLLER
jgi:hypothetical protein